MVEEKIKVPLEQIRAFCTKWRIREFSLFGSVLREDFRSDSDVDVLVELEPEAPWSLFEWVEMIDELKRMFRRNVDLVEKTAIQNPFRRRAILGTRKVLYAA